MKLLNFKEVKGLRNQKYIMYLVEGTRDSIHNEIPFCFNTEAHPKTYEEAMKSRDVFFFFGNKTSMIK